MRFLNSRNIEAAKISEERRRESRTDLCVGLWVFPLSANEPNIDAAVPAVTKDLSSTGVALVVNQAITNKEVLLYLAVEGDPRLLRAKVRDCRPIGAGYNLVAVEVLELLAMHEYPQLGDFDVAAEPVVSPNYS